MLFFPFVSLVILSSLSYFEYKFQCVCAQCIFPIHNSQQFFFFLLCQFLLCSNCYSCLARSITSTYFTRSHTHTHTETPNEQIHTHTHRAHIFVCTFYCTMGTGIHARIRLTFSNCVYRVFVCVCITTNTFTRSSYVERTNEGEMNFSVRMKQKWFLLIFVLFVMENRTRQLLWVASIE